MRIVTATEGARQALDEVITKLEAELSKVELELAQPTLWTKSRFAEILAISLKRKLRVLKTIVAPDEPMTTEQTDVLFAEGALPLFYCHECGAAHRERLFELGSGSHTFRVCFVCITKFFLDTK